MRWPYNFQSGLVCLSYSFGRLLDDGLFKIAHFCEENRGGGWCDGDISTIILRLLPNSSASLVFSFAQTEGRT